MTADPFDLTGRSALVTGASRGIGRSIAACLAARGASVMLTSRKAEGVAAVAAEISEAGGRAEAMACHAGDPEQIGNAVAETCKRFGRIDILVNNAAANPYYGPVIDMELAAYQKTVDVNIRGYLWAAIQAARRMRDQGGGAIVNVASVNGVRPMEGQVVYSMSKAAVMNMTQGLAREWGRHGIRVNALLPGITETRFAAALHQDPKNRAKVEMLLPLGRIAQPDEMAAAVLYLVSDGASYTTGSCLTVDGGWLA